MSSARAVTKPIIVLLCIGVSAAGLVNVYGDDGETVEQAKKAACGAGRCDLLRTDRTPFSRTYGFAVAKGSAEAVCTRSAIFLGDFDCVKK